jgi:glycosyltransferase involved in cell wall biosynthesis
MHAGKRVAVVVPALDEEASIAAVVRGFRALPAVDLVLVVDNGSRDGTAERAREAGATVVGESRPGYGSALRAGIEQALGLGMELVVLAEADGTFDPTDLERLLAALAGHDRSGHDMVLGSRTAEMRGGLRHGNRLVAWLLSSLWPRSSCRLTDVGCTYRVLSAEAWRRLRAGVPADGPEFSPQMIAVAFARRLAVCEIPVRYGTRASGASKHTGSTWAATRTALRMLRAILAQRVRAR